MPGDDKHSVPPHRLLLVEDDLRVREAIRCCLEHLGYEVIEATTGAEALALAERQQPDLILLDLGLPDADGLVVARELRWRPNTAKIPIAAFTGEPISGRRAEVLAGLCAGLIPKPVGLDRLGREIRRLLGARRGPLRRFPRYRLEATVGWRPCGSGNSADPRYATGVARTVSEGGLMVELPLPLPVETLVELRLEAPVGAVSAVGKVVWWRFQSGETARDGAYQNGLQFLDLGPGGRAAIRRLIPAAAGAAP